MPHACLTASCVAVRTHDHVLNRQQQQLLIGFCLLQVADVAVAIFSVVFCAGKSLEELLTVFVSRVFRLRTFWPKCATYLCHTKGRALLYGTIVFMPEKAVTRPKYRSPLS